VKRILQWLMAAVFVFAGITHFTATEFFVQIVPPYVPWHLAMVYVSGVFEIALGILLLVPGSTRCAAWGLIALLIAVFPANIHMAVNDVHVQNSPFGQPSRTALWLRLPLQGVLIAWAWWYTVRPQRRIAEPIREKSL
jgi:uncharacterized membrane protein